MADQIIDGITPLNNINCYSQIIDPIITTKNMYYEIDVTVAANQSDNNNQYKSYAIVAMGTMLRNTKVPINGYGVILKNDVTNQFYYDLYTAQFNNDYGGQGINSVSIPYQSGISSLGYDKYTVGVGWNYQTKKLFYHINPTQYGDEYGLAIENVTFPENTRIYILGIDVDKKEFSSDVLSNPLRVWIKTRSGFKYQSVADKYLNGGG